MIKWFQGALLTVVALHLSLPVAAQNIETRAEFAIMMDYETGAVLFQKDADQLMAPASMSKLMTIAVLFDKIKNGSLSLDDELPVSERAWRMGGSKMFVMVDTTIRVEDLIRGIVVQSGNDACIVVAEGISGSEEAFADEMTRLARDIGMETSVFANSTGMPNPGHRMTARELAILAAHIIREYPDLYRYYAETEFTWADINQPNRNPLLYADMGADGLKTGHTEESGYGLVGSAVQDGRRLILVVNGLASESERSTESQRLLRVGFRDFKFYDLFAASDVVGTAEVWQGDQPVVDLTVKDPVALFMRPKDRRSMKVSINYEGPVKAPIQQGDQVAELRITLPGDTVALAQPLYAAETVGPMGIFGKMGMALKEFVMGQVSETGN